MKKLGIFDIDGTIFRSALFLELVYGLVDSKIFPKRVLKDVEDEYTAWANRRGSYMDYVHASWDVFVCEIKGKNEKTVNEAIDQFLLKHRDRVYRFTRNLIKDLKKENFFLLAISGSPTHVVSNFAKYTGFDYSIGSEFEVRNGKFTGKMLFDASQNKGKILQEFISKRSEKFDLKNSFGVGDAKIDISFLEMVGNPIAFNPSRELAKYAKEKNWKIVVERKDVIYEIADFKFNG